MNAHLAGQSIRNAARFAAACTLLGLIGCAASTTPAKLNLPEVVARVPTLEDELAAAFAPGRAILDGVTVAPDLASLGSDFANFGAGDSVLLGLMIRRDGRDGVSEQTVRFLHIETTGEVSDPPKVDLTLTERGEDGRTKRVTIGSMVFRTTLGLYDETGTLLVKSPARVLAAALATGLYDAVGPRIAAIEQGAIDSDGKPDESAVGLTTVERRLARLGWVSLVAFSGAVGGGRNKPLTDLLQEVVARPSLLEFFLRPEFSLEYGPYGAKRGETWAIGGVARPTRHLQLDASLAGRLSVRSDLLVTPISRPLGLCGGLLALDGTRADDSGVRLYVRLLGARLGVQPNAGLPSEWPKTSLPR